MCNKDSGRGNCYGKKVIEPQCYPIQAKKQTNKKNPISLRVYLLFSLTSSKTFLNSNGLKDNLEVI